MVKIAIILCALFVTPQAFACGVMEKADPKVGSTVTPTDHVTLYFSQAFDPKQTSAVLRNENEDIAVKTSTDSSNTILSLHLAKPLPPGSYKVAWEALWLDCDSKTQGNFPFSVKKMDSAQ